MPKFCITQMKEISLINHVTFQNFNYKWKKRYSPDKFPVTVLSSQGRGQTAPKVTGHDTARRVGIFRLKEELGGAMWF